MNKNNIKVGDKIRVDEEVYVVADKHSESVFCRNVHTGFNAYIDYVDIEEIVR